MKEVKTTTKYRKDFKRYANNKKKIQKLFGIVKLLQDEMSIPAEYKPHMLVGDYAGFMECHIEGDFLLIWIENDCITLSRLGSHAELFDK